MTAVNKITLFNKLVEEMKDCPFKRVKTVKEINEQINYKMQDVLAKKIEGFPDKSNKYFWNFFDKFYCLTLNKKNLNKFLQDSQPKKIQFDDIIKDVMGKISESDLKLDDMDPSNIMAEMFLPGSKIQNLVSSITKDLEEKKMNGELDEKNLEEKIKTFMK